MADMAGLLLLRTSLSEEEIGANPRILILILAPESITPLSNFCVS